MNEFDEIKSNLNDFKLTLISLENKVDNLVQRFILTNDSKKVSIDDLNKIMRFIRDINR